MKPLSISISGLARLARVASKYRLDRLSTLGLRLPFWLTVLLLPLRLKPAPNPNVGTDLKLALIELGPAFIKLGQLLSTRRDVLPDSVSDELASLQDQVPGIDSTLALNTIKASAITLSRTFKRSIQSPSPRRRSLKSMRARSLTARKLSSNSDARVLKP